MKVLYFAEIKDILQQLSNVCYSINVREHEDFTAFEQWLLNKIKNDCDTQLT